VEAVPVRSLDKGSEKILWTAKEPRRKSDSSACGMTASPLNEDTRTFRITNDSHAISAAGDMLSIFTEKPCLSTGTLYESADSSTENLI